MATQNEAGAATRTVWQLDPNHTLVQFTGKHMMITTVRGHFKGVRGTIILDEADPSRSWVEVEIDAASLYSSSPPTSLRSRSTLLSLSRAPVSSPRAAIVHA